LLKLQQKERKKGRGGREEGKKRNSTYTGVRLNKFIELMK
jgi:hypothetical protein